ncbi:geranylgeranylglyceryl/heptaprenylglyceryl phosphate synthase [Geofilum sp. OHC36d9]|uniref:geranylgeranylglyceryl/heptaprenylglyceryl phosphate synthase n=1 Tax=Geofilum sp. OHC36d9 TaxID=3458413 RepID=UPI004033C528
MIYNIIKNSQDKQTKKLLPLIDPDKLDEHRLSQLSAVLKNHAVPFVVVGGSLISSPIAPVIETLKAELNLPIILYPGHPTHIVQGADGIFLLSMISGRNPDLLIGHHVAAAPQLRRLNLEIIPTGYMLIDGGCTTSVEYISQTRPIPANKTDIAVATAMAGEMLGLKLIYMDAGSGALNAIPYEMIAAVKQAISIPLLIGGGIRTSEQLKKAYSAGADMIIVGNILEKDPLLLDEFLTIAENW